VLLGASYVTEFSLLHMLDELFGTKLADSICKYAARRSIHAKPYRLESFVARCRSQNVEQEIPQPALSSTDQAMPEPIYTESIGAP
jgi:hypothetical protein